MNTLYYGDNLDILREHIPDESIDLIYLDPPFNSNRSYNVLFQRRPTGQLQVPRSLHLIFLALGTSLRGYIT